MDPLQLNAIDFESGEKPLRSFLREHARKLPAAINLTVQYRSENGRIGVSVWSYGSDSKHITTVKEQLGKVYKLSFGPVEENGRGQKYYSATQEMGIDEFTAFLKAVDEKGSTKVIEALKKDYDELESERTKGKQAGPKPVPKTVLDTLREKFAVAAKEIDAFYPGNTRADCKAYAHFSDAKREVRPGMKLAHVLDKIKEAVGAFDEEEKNNVNKSEVAKVKMHLIGLQGLLENAVKTPAEGKGMPPKPAEPGKQTPRVLP